MSAHSARRLLPLVAALAVAVSAAFLGPLAPPAAAHAELIAADPAINATLSGSPDQITLTFSEAPDPSLSLVQVINAFGHAVPGQTTTQTVPGNPGQLRVLLGQALPRGVYTVNWRAVSAADGHESQGAYAFGVGVANVAEIAPFGKLAHTSRWLSAAAAAGRWALYCGLVLLVGAAATGWAAFGGGLPGGGRLVLRLGGLLAAAGVATAMLTERAIVSAPSLLPLFRTAVGKSLVAQFWAVVACAATIVIFELWPHRWTLTAVGAAGAVALFVHEQAGHANVAGSWRVAHLAEQSVHVLAMATWIGGLAWLLLGLRHLPRTERAPAISRYSRLATVAIAMVALTGLLRAITEVGAVGDLVTTSYGLTLLAKVCLFALLAALGAVNHFRLVPALPKREALLRPFGLTTRGELAVAAAIFAVTAALTGLAPAAFAGKPVAGPRAISVATSDLLGAVHGRLTVSPGTAGRNTFTVSLSSRGGALTTARAVVLQLSVPAQTAIGPSTLSLAPGSTPGEWRATGMPLSIAGAWNIEIDVTEASGSTAVLPATLNVGQ